MHLNKTDPQIKTFDITKKSKGSNKFILYIIIFFLILAIIASASFAFIFNHPTVNLETPVNQSAINSNSDEDKTIQVIEDPTITPSINTTQNPIDNESNNITQTVKITTSPSITIKPNTNVYVRFENNLKWQTIYPITWSIKAYGQDGDEIPSKTSDHPYILSPDMNFDKDDVRNAKIGFAYIQNYAPDLKDSNDAYNYFFVLSQESFGRTIIKEEDIKINNLDSKLVIFTENPNDDYPNGQLREFIYVKNPNKKAVMEIEVDEYAKNKSIIKSTDDWKLNEYFHNIISNFKFL